MPLPMPEVRAGDLRERVAFEYRAVADDGFGNTTSGNWVGAFLVGPDNRTFAAKISPLRGGEGVQASRLAGRQPARITVRSSSDTLQVQVEWRVRDVRKGVAYNIRSIVNPDERGIFLDMECEAGVAI